MNEAAGVSCSSWAISRTNSSSVCWCGSQLSANASVSVSCMTRSSAPGTYVRTAILSGQLGSGGGASRTARIRKKLRT